ncbi:hypothetical protein [uncultured Winogradskyella sp.]|uniref:hypothetical protein n=1 Tax=uncultured Winogradskyella sp. TaxID=395353 RepID=UPI0026131986|nr:hypothetical protein [uncultured Winogradskyella sp.]
MKLFNSKIKLLKGVIIIVLIAVCFWVLKSKAFHDYYSAYQWKKNRISNQNIQVYSEFDSLKTDDYIQFESIKGFKAQKTYNYAKVTKITKDSVTIVPFLFMRGIKLNLIDRHYNKEKENLQSITLSRKDLENGICDNYFPMIGFTFCGVEFLDSKEKLRLSNINNTTEPIIRFSDLDIKDSGKFYISFYNVGQPIYMQKIIVSNDTIRFFQKNEFPYLIGKKDSKNSHFALAGTGWDKDLETSVELTVMLDTLSDKTYTFKLSTYDESIRKFERIN